MWNVFDTAFLAIFCVYLVLRLRGIVYGDCMLFFILLKLLVYRPSFPSKLPRLKWRSIFWPAGPASSYPGSSIFTLLRSGS